MNKTSQFLSNKQVTCDFCKEQFGGNLNQANIIMCDKCVRWLCSASQEKRVEFYHRFDGDKDRQKVIKRFINEEALLNGETQGNTGHSTGGGNNPGALSSSNKIW